MWVLKFLPDWIFYAILFIGFTGLIASRFIPTYYKAAVASASAALFVFGVFMSGAIHNEGVWQAKVKELELRYAESQVKSEQATTEVVTKFITKKEIVRERGEDVVRYIDREIVKYNETCRLPKEAVAAHNQAARIGASK